MKSFPAAPTHPRHDPAPHGGHCLLKLSPVQLFPSQGSHSKAWIMWSPPGHPELSVPPSFQPRAWTQLHFSYLQSSVGHIQHPCISPQALNEITKFILVEKDTNKKDLKIPQSLAIPQSARPVESCSSSRVCFPFRESRLLPPAFPCISSLFPG